MTQLLWNIRNEISQTLERWWWHLFWPQILISLPVWAKWPFLEAFFTPMAFLEYDIFLKKIQLFFHNRLTLMTETILQMYNITVHFFQVHGHYSFFHFPGHYSFHFPGHYFFHFLFLGDRFLYLVTSLNAWVSTPPVVSAWLIPSGRACLGVPAHHVCSTYVSAPQVQPPVPVLAATYNTVSVSLSS